MRLRLNSNNDRKLMKKFLAVIFLLIAAYLTFGILMSVLNVYRSGLLGTFDASNFAYIIYTLILLITGLVVFVLTKIALKWLRPAKRIPLDAIDDNLVE